MSPSRYKNILLLNFYYSESGYGEKLQYPPTGIGYISEYLEQSGYDTFIIDMGVGYSLRDMNKLVEECIEKNSIELIGISLNSINLSLTMDFMEKIHKKYKVDIFVGGPHASSAANAILEKYYFIKYAIRHEGEQSVLDLMKGKSLEEISGIYYREKNIIKGNSSVHSTDLSKFPYPKYGKFELDKYSDTDTIGIVTSRGCPYLCGFCQQSSLLGKKWRSRNAENVVNEIIYWYKRGKRNIHVIDDMFLMDRKRIFEIGELLKKANLKDLKLISVGGFRINHCDYETLKELKNMGFSIATFGVESGTDRVLKFIRKNITTEQIEKTINMACEIGFKVKLFFILGLPTQTKEEAMESIALAQKYPIYKVRFFNFMPYEDTYLMNWLKENDAKFFYSYEEVMNNFKKYQDIPVFEEKNGMKLKEKVEILKVARKVQKSIDDKNKILNS